MTNVFKKHTLPVLVMLLYGLATAGISLAGEKKVLTLEDYPLWKQIVSTSISPDGNWVTYGYRPNDGDDTLYVRSTTGDTVHEVAGGTEPVFSEDSTRVVYFVNLPKDEAEKLRKEKKPVPKKCGILNLTTGETSTVDTASSFLLAKSSAFLAVQRDKTDSDAKHDGTDLLLIDLRSGQTRNLGNVAEFKFDETGRLLAYTVDSADQEGNGVYLLNLATGAFTPLDTGRHKYTQLAWHARVPSLAVVRGNEDETRTERANVLLAWHDVDRESRDRVAYDPSKDPSFPEGMVISEKGSLAFSEDNTRIFLGTKEQETKPQETKDPVPNVDVWHWADERIQSVQMIQANNDRRFTYRAAVLFDGPRFVQLATEEMPTVNITKDGRWAVGEHDKPYRLRPTWGGNLADHYRMDTATGEKFLITRELARPVGISPDSRWYLYLKDKKVWVTDLHTGRTQDLSTGTKISFVNEDDDHPYEKPIYGLAGWSQDGKSVFLYHRFDIWSLPLDGSPATNITMGVGDREKIRFRYVELDPEEDGGPVRGRGGRRREVPKAIDTSRALLLSAYGEWTKKSGYFSLRLGEPPQPLLYDDESVGVPVKAKNAERLMFTRETFVQFPDHYVSGLDFKDPVRLTDANPQQADYAWGRRVLIDYRNSKGVPLQATLTLPAGYVEGKKYPMLVYFYEKMSQRHHEYSMPRYDDRPHMSTYASDGYLVLMPDIVYETGYPGDSALDCVTAAVDKVVELGYADPEHIGLQGHSWGGYETSFILTQTDQFACIVTGAPLTNLVALFNELYKSSGNVNHGVTQYGQVRMGVTPWDDLQLYISQSAIHNAAKISTPFLILHGTEDGAVDWNQGLALYSAARRLDKKVILLSYPGEGHHLSKLENQKDFQTRMKQFFDHYLKDKPAADWMIEGVPFLRKPKSAGGDR